MFPSCTAVGLFSFFFAYWPTVLMFRCLALGLTSGLYLHTSSYSFKLVHKCHLSYRATSHFRFKLTHGHHWSYRSICFPLQVGAWAPFVVSINLFPASSWRMGAICRIAQFVFRFELAHGRHLSYRSICFPLQVGAWAPFVVSINLFPASSWRMGAICRIAQFVFRFNPTNQLHQPNLP